MTYLLDANVFIQAKNLHYGLDFCPAFWDWLLDNNAAGRVFSIDKVADEIAAGADELTDWMRQKGNGLFRKTDTHIAAQFGKVSTWATGHQMAFLSEAELERWPLPPNHARVKHRTVCLTDFSDERFFQSTSYRSS